MSRAMYRSRQFVTSLRPHVNAALRDEAFSLLSEPQRRLFESMTVRDQQHCLDVYRCLRAKRHDDRDLLVAGLLHDCGKGQIALWHRVAYVVLDAAAPGFLQGIAAQGDGPSWREALYRCVHHAELGARLAEQAGSSSRVIELIRGEQDAETSEQLAALRAADDTA
jgi:HD-like signal output (HDOD) protein